MKIRIIIPYFGDWPIWFSYFLQTCKANPEINWLIYSDNSPPEYSPNNVIFINGSLKGLSHLASLKLNLSIKLVYPYKICDLRPSFGKIFEDYLKDFDFWGYSDLDLFYGKIKHFITEDLLSEFDIISVRKSYFAGHLAFYRNTGKVNNLYKKGHGYRRIFENSTRHFAYDERLNFLGKDLTNEWEKSKLFSRLKLHIIKLRYLLIKKVLTHPIDMTEIIKVSVKHNQIKYFAEDMVISDLRFYKQGISEWEIIWNNGVLWDSYNKKELLHFHIIKSKGNRGLKIDEWFEKPEFKITKHGISYCI